MNPIQIKDTPFAFTVNIKEMELSSEGLPHSPGFEITVNLLDHRTGVVAVLVDKVSMRRNYTARSFQLAELSPFLSDVYQKLQEISERNSLKLPISAEADHLQTIASAIEKAILDFSLELLHKNYQRTQSISYKDANHDKFLIEALVIELERLNTLSKMRYSESAEDGGQLRRRVDELSLENQQLKGWRSIAIGLQAELKNPDNSQRKLQDLAQENRALKEQVYNLKMAHESLQKTLVRRAESHAHPSGETETTIKRDEMRSEMEKSALLTTQLHQAQTQLEHITKVMRELQEKLGVLETKNTVQNRNIAIQNEEIHTLLTVLKKNLIASSFPSPKAGSSSTERAKNIPTSSSTTSTHSSSIFRPRRKFERASGAGVQSEQGHNETMESKVK